MSLLVGALSVFSLAACGFAFAKGGPGERIGAGVILLNLIASLAPQGAAAQLIPLVIDGVTAIVLLVVAVRYASLWLGAVMLLYALQFGMHAFYLVLEKPKDIMHALINNNVFFWVSVCLIAGTAVTWRRRVRAAKAATAIAAA
jgi:prolipoprotein diacylglyceryltransferase